MSEVGIAQGLSFHDIPSDLKELLMANPQVLQRRNSLTDIMRNEWICRVTIVKKEETRQTHLRRLSEELSNPQGNKTPCCRPGCPHRREKAKKFFH